MARKQRTPVAFSVWSLNLHARTVFLVFCRTFTICRWKQAKPQIPEYVHPLLTFHFRNPHLKTGCQFQIFRHSRCFKHQPASPVFSSSFIYIFISKSQTLRLFFIQHFVNIEGQSCLMTIVQNDSLLLLGFSYEIIGDDKESCEGCRRDLQRKRGRTVVFVFDGHELALVPNRPKQIVIGLCGNWYSKIGANFNSWPVWPVWMDQQHVQCGNTHFKDFSQPLWFERSKLWSAWTAAGKSNNSSFQRAVCSVKKGIFWSIFTGIVISLRLLSEVALTFRLRLHRQENSAATWAETGSRPLRSPYLCFTAHVLRDRTNLLNQPAANPLLFTPLKHKLIVKFFFPTTEVISPQLFTTGYVDRHCSFFWACLW